MRALVASTLVLILAACSPAAEPAKTGAEPVAAEAATIRLGAINLSQPVRAAGTEPFWTIDIADGVMTYRDMEDFGGDVTTPRTGPAAPVVTGDAAVYAVTLSDGKSLTLTLTATECPDIGEETRALTASLAIPGAMTQQACADARSAYPPET
jgi:uncharacterized membrane protein